MSEKIIKGSDLTGHNTFSTVSYFCGVLLLGVFLLMLFLIITIYHRSISSYFRGNMPLILLILLLPAWIAIISGLVALSYYNKNPEIGGKGKAIMGLILGVLFFVFVTIVFIHGFISWMNNLQLINGGF